ncbi:hydrogenase maturation nickel metallochaperone HypA [Hoeflea sp.]|uniref:hydrogenase maturation nickel metallochaperone HypA n=1 Tax=Hoeflea sp. TaxID=1940281 RepID=UPI003749BC79
MHEMSLMESVLEIACETALKNGAVRVKSIRLDIGMLSHVDPEALMFCYDAIRNGSIAEEAELEINRVPGMGWCIDCAKTVPITARFDLCPECSNAHVEMTAGDDMKIRELEVI